jgi:hypothetical protein
VVALVHPERVCGAHQRQHGPQLRGERIRQLDAPDHSRRLPPEGLVDRRRLPGPELVQVLSGVLQLCLEPRHGIHGPLQLSLH